MSATADAAAKDHEKSTSSADAVVGEVNSGKPDPVARKPLAFWLVFPAICVPLFLAALEYTAVSSALPTIVHDLNGDDFVWIASAYALAATALQPAAGGMAQIFGRRATLSFSLALFALGSALCGAAQSMNWLIAARTVQGAGGGALLNVANIVISDLVPLRERPLYNSITGVSWAIATGIGPLVGGGLAQIGQWRWLFYLNLPITGFAAIFIVMFLKLPTPPGTFREKLGRMDWIGNILIIASSTACVIALSWGGVRYPWSSARVLAPLVLGVCGLFVALLYEARIAKEPLVPFSLFTNRTSVSGYIQTFIGPMMTMSILYFGATYFQACKGSSPGRAGLDLFACSATIGPVLLLTGFWIAYSKTYRIPLWAGWACFTAAMAGMSTVHADTPIGVPIGLFVLACVGGGLVFASAYYPVLAPLPATSNAHAMAFFAFCRSFAGVWAVSIGTAILQTQLTHRLPAGFLAQFPDGVAIAYSAIPLVPALNAPLRAEVQRAFADSIVVIWQVLTGLSAFAFLASFAMKGLPLHTQMDKRWALENGKEKTAPAAAGESEGPEKASV